jgi:SAM-dependent methyltransferase
MTAADPRTAKNRRQFGGGSGNFKEFAADVLSSDIAFAPWLDLVADAQRLPLAPQSVANIVMFDVLHHIEFPKIFFAEAARVIAPCGRIVMVEPAITPASWPFYRFVHPEPVQMGDDPLADGTPDARRDAFDANQAFPSLLVGRFRRRFAELFPMLRLQRTEWLSLFAYPLSGGFQPWSAIPAAWVAPVIKLETALAPLLGRLMAFRMLIVIDVAPR